MPSCHLVVLSLLLPTFYAPAAEVQEPLFVLHSVSDETVTGPLERLDEKWSIRMGGAKPGWTDGGDVIALRRADVSLPPLPPGEQILLANGDCLAGRVRGLAGENVTIQASFGEKPDLKLPLSGISVIWLVVPDGTEEPEQLRRRLWAEKRTRDSVLLRNGDVQEGVLTGLDRKKLYLEAEGKELSVEFNKAAIIAFNTDLVRLPRPKGPHAFLVLTDGSRLTLASARADGRALKGKTAWGAEIEVPLVQVAALDMRQGRADYLSDLKPSRYEFTPFLDVRWPYGRDGGIQGHDLRLGDHVYDKGLSMRAESRLSYDLKGGYRRFEAVVGLDERGGNQGVARIAVLVDGKPRDLGGEKELSPDGKPLPIRIDVTGAKELTLSVEFVRRPGAALGNVHWCDARLIKKK